jgi:PAS domain S-box-containing protein
MRNSKILIVEDEGLTAMELQQKLKFWGYDVPSFAFSKKEAVMKAKKIHPDLILMDIVLKGEGDGIDATVEINNFLNVPIIYLTAYDDKETMKRVQIVEPSDYILKPYKDSELHESIERALNGHKVAKKLIETGEYLDIKLEDAGGAVIITDKEGFVVFMNPTAQNLTGQKIDKAMDLTEIFKIRIGNSIVDLKQPDDKKHHDNQILSDMQNESYQQAVKDIINEGIVKGVTEEVYLQAEEGNEIPIEYYAYPVRDDNGSFLGAALVFNDISKDLEAGKSLLESEKKFKTIYSESQIGIAIYNENGIIKDVNNRALQIFGVEDIKGIDHLNLFNDFKLGNKEKKVLMDGKEVQCEFDFNGHEDFNTKESPEVYLEIRVKPVSFADNSPNFYQAHFHDITKYKNIESELINSVNLLEKENIGIKEDFESTKNSLELELADIKNNEKVLNDLSKELEDRLNKTSKELSKTQEDLKSSTENHKKQDESLNQTIEKLEAELVDAGIKADEVEKLEAEITNTRNKSDEIIEKLQNELDARLVIEEDLTNKYQTIKSQFDGVTSELSSTKMDMESLVTKHVETENSLIKMRDDLQNQLEIKDSNLEKVKEDLELEINNRDQLDKQYKSSQADLKNQLEEKEAEYMESINKMESKIAELKLLNNETSGLLKEREAQIKDITDRTKNDMQRISSLTSLQSNYIRNKMIENFRDSQKHIKSMSMVHEKIYEYPDQGQINISQYLNSLVEEIFRHNSADHNRISIDIQVENVFLDVDKATACGLIINELVSNSIKHAFPKGRDGQIGIELKNKEEYIDMVVTDNGVGLPEIFDFNDIETLGLQIVKTLICEIEGKIDIEKDNGTRFRIQFVK